MSIKKSYGGLFWNYNCNWKVVQNLKSINLSLDGAFSLLPQISIDNHQYINSSLCTAPVVVLFWCVECTVQLKITLAASSSLFRFRFWIFLWIHKLVKFLRKQEWWGFCATAVVWRPDSTTKVRSSGLTRKLSKPLSNGK